MNKLQIIETVYNMQMSQSATYFCVQLILQKHTTLEIARAIVNINHTHLTHQDEVMIVHLAMLLTQSR